MQVGYNMINFFNITVYNVKFLFIKAPSFKSFQYFVKKWKMGTVDIKLLTLFRSEDSQVIWLSPLKVSLTRHSKVIISINVQPCSFLQDTHWAYLLFHLIHCSGVI